MKRYAPLTLLFAGMFFAGCAWHKSASQSAPGPSTRGGGASTAATQPIVTPDTSLTAKVISYNDIGRYVVLGFPVGQMPKPGMTLFLYRNGLKVAEVSVESMRTDSFVVADLVSGTAQVGDEARDR